MKGVVDTVVRWPGPVVGQGIVSHAVHQASLASLGLQHGLQSVWGDELVPLVCTPWKETNNVLRPHYGQ